ncbi:hypothetical protein HZH66_014257 [Vespula vulgaris]|uniref:Uncharacterized protein n=1 Tax=Vespula vulgaris TaxID=7454 RepID=A0A834J8C2_VESVU|nr:hypothetical protein HZH66_014257 [Vespula vulgaris]
MASDSRPDDTGHELTEPSRGTVADIQTGGRSTVGAPALLEEEPWFVLLPTDAVNRRRQADASTSAPSQEEDLILFRSYLRPRDESTVKL